MLDEPVDDVPGGRELARSGKEPTIALDHGDVEPFAPAAHVDTGAPGGRA